MPQYSANIDNGVAIEPQKAPPNPSILIDNNYFPEEVFDTSPDSLLFKFFQSLVGPSGIGWLRKNLFEARMILEEHGFQNNQLDQFYSNPLNLSRNITNTPFAESYTEDPKGILTREEWNVLKSKDEAYRSRILDFLHAARLGNTPEGIKLAARSAVGYSFDLIENYQYMFDQHSDEVIGLESFRSEKYSKIYNANEITLIPNQEKSQTLIKKITFANSEGVGVHFETISSGYITIKLAGEVAEINWDITTGITSFDIETALANFNAVGTGNVLVTGDIASGFIVKLFNHYSDIVDQSFDVESQLFDKYNLDIPISATVETSWFNQPSVEVRSLNEYDSKLVDSAVEKLKPVNSYISYGQGQGVYENQEINTVASSSKYFEVIKYVKGSNKIQWPTPNAIYWIEAGIEKESPKVLNDLQQHYKYFHKPVSIISYSNDVAPLTFPVDPINFNKSQHSGFFNKEFADTFSLSDYLQNSKRELSQVDKVDYAIASFPEPLAITSRADQYAASYVNGIYPMTDELLTIVQQTSDYTNKSNFWASVEAVDGSESLEIDLGAPKAVNFVTFQIFKTPLDIEISYDKLGQGGTRSFVPVTPDSNFPFASSMHFDSSEIRLPWRYITFSFFDKYGDIPFTQYIKIKFTRRNNEAFQSTVNGQTRNNPWPVLVKNLRIGRNV